ncbi:hypothetical protein M0R72_03945 [Candidatus Pacearchaeota archaeon]|jgi:hypothetical protein|nr:hypothetical protein [Candidatus Pacearchaeota archaeon]
MKFEKAIIFDAGIIINFAMNGLLEEFRGLKKIFNGKFLITKEVKLEVVDKPLSIKRFMLEALKIKELLNDKTLEMPSDIGVDENLITKMTNEIRDHANSIFYTRGEAIQIIASGEASCIALSKILTEKNINNVIAVDERTIRVLFEKPENLESLLGKKLHAHIQAKTEQFKEFKGYKFIRSAELIYVAYKKGIVKLKNHNFQILDALLYALKFNGCAISDEEISEIEKMNKNN